VAVWQRADVREHDDRGAVVDGGGVREMGLAEALRRREVHARAERRGQGKGQRAVCWCWRVKVCVVFETWAKGIPRHSSGEWNEMKRNQVLGPTGISSGVVLIASDRRVFWRLD